MARLRQFAENPEAKLLHTQGLKLIKRDIDGAHELYGQAQELLQHDSGLDEFSTMMQLARVIRDDGFLHVRQAAKPETGDRVSEIRFGAAKLYISREFTQKLKDRKLGVYEPEAWRFLRSEHGATVGLIGRLATVALVAQEDFDLQGWGFYEEAHRDLTKGSNRYYETSNAINAARHSLIIGRHYTKSVWQNRAYEAAVNAAKEDPANESAAMKTYLQRKKYLKSQKVAVKSVLKNP